MALGKPELMREANYNAMDLGVDSVKAEGKWVPNVFKRESMWVFFPNILYIFSHYTQSH